MPSFTEVQQVREHLQSYLTGALLPFWMNNAPDPEYGGFLSYFDRYGKATGETDKPFLMQARMLFTMSSAHRAGYGGGRCAELAQQGARFISQHYWDDQYDGWYWIANRLGKPTVPDKVGYGHCFGIYSFSEYFLATGDPLGKEMALRAYDAVSRHMVDTRYGGYLELFTRDWRPSPGGRYGGDRKSLDVHMHMMEALTTLYELTGLPSHRRRLEDVIDLILTRMLHPLTGLGFIQFTYDFQPLPRIIFATEWGRDARPAEGAAPIDQTSPGHNVELAWLLQHALDVLGAPQGTHLEMMKRQYDHCVEFGIDHAYGGVYADTPMTSPAVLTEKQFWQQAEVLIGMLDAYRLFGDEKYWQAFRNVYDFVFGKMVVMEAGGEWYERLDRFGTPIDPILGHAWKINYHSVRSMVQSIERLKQIERALG